MPFGTEKKIDRVKMWLQTDERTGQLFGDNYFKCPKENTNDEKELLEELKTNKDDNINISKGDYEKCCWEARMVVPYY